MGRTRDQLERNLSVPADELDQALSNLIDKGIVESDDEGGWQLTEQGWAMHRLQIQKGD